MKQLFIGVGAAAIAALSAGTVVMATAPPTPKEVLTITPSAFDPGVDQALLSGTGCSSTVLGTCHFKITETSGSNKPVQWVADWIGGDGAGNFTPSGGTLHPGRSVTVTATGMCNDQGDSAIFVSGSGPVASGQTTGDDTTVAAIAVLQCG